MGVRATERLSGLSDMFPSAPFLRRCAQPLIAALAVVSRRNLGRAISSAQVRSRLWLVGTSAADRPCAGERPESVNSRQGRVSGARHRRRAARIPAKRRDAGGGTRTPDTRIMMRRRRGFSLHIKRFLGLRRGQNRALTAMIVRDLALRDPADGIMARHGRGSARPKASRVAAGMK